MEAIVGLLGVVIGSVLTAWLTEIAPRSNARRQATLNLLDKYTSLEFNVARHAIVQIRRNWATGDRSIVRFFTVTEPRPAPDEEQPCANGLTPHQNLSWLLHFYASVAVFDQERLVDAKLLRKFFEPAFARYATFFAEFIAEYKRLAAPEERVPVWVTALPYLEAKFGLITPPSQRQRGDAPDSDAEPAGHDT